MQNYLLLFYFILILYVQVHCACIMNASDTLIVLIRWCWSVYCFFMCFSRSCFFIALELLNSMRACYFDHLTIFWVKFEQINFEWNSIIKIILSEMRSSNQFWMDSNVIIKSLLGKIRSSNHSRMNLDQQIIFEWNSTNV